MPQAGSKPKHYHLIAGLVALALVSGAVSYAPELFHRLDREALAPVILQPCMAKDMGMALQGFAFSEPAILPVYGSSELTRPCANRADHFFRNSPTGFRVCPIGSAGNTCLMIAQKCASMGKRLQDHKLVVMLSSSWFRRTGIPADHYAGNFSPAQASDIVQGAEVDARLARRMARRMLDFPGSLEAQPALHAFTHALITKDPVAKGFGLIQSPILRMQRLEYSMEDKLGTLFGPTTKASRADDFKDATSEPFSWEKIIALAPSFAYPEITGPPSPHVGHGDAAFIANMRDSKEWQDLDLLLDVLHSLRAKPLVVAIPFDGLFEDSHGISRAARDWYYGRIDEACKKRGFPMSHLADHDRDPGMVIEHSSHPSGKGWIFFDKLFDDFYHDRLPSCQPNATHA